MSEISKQSRVVEIVKHVVLPIVIIFAAEVFYRQPLYQ